MNLRTYRAYTMAEALTAVKRDLGPDAVILNTRSSRTGGFLGIGRASIVEVTAVPAEEAAAPKRVKPRPAQSASANRAYGAAGNVPAVQAARESHQEDQVTDGDRRKTQEFAREMLARLEAQQPVADRVEVRSTTPAPIEQSAPKQPAVDVGPGETATAHTEPRQAAAQRFVLQTPNRETAANGSGVANDVALPANRIVEPKTTAPRQNELTEPSPELDQMQSELTAIRQMVGKVLHRQGSGAPPNVPEQLFDHYLQLVSQDLSEELADQIINEVRIELSGTDLDDAPHVRDVLCRVLSEYVPCSDEPVALESPDDRPLTIALVGPTGVGKTTTLAKLAATMKLQHDLSVGLITSDTYRIAAVDQLRTYAGIIGLPVEVVLTPAEMSRAVARMQHLDAILIDTAGRSQRDTSRIDELRQFIEAGQPHEVHLVLSSTASEKVMMQEAEAFACVGVDKLVFTKLDEAVSFGMLINVARQLGTQLSFLTTGQEVPDHLEIGQPSRLAELVLGGALHT